jgi:DNA-binding NarL/FixJ family response regulator
MNFHPLRRSNILVIHPDPIVCAGIVAALRPNPRFEVLIHGVDALGTDALHFDVIIADYRNALRLTDARARSALRVGEPRILALTSDDREADIRRAIEAGVYGYLLVGGALDELVDGVTAVANGLRYMSMSVAQRMADSLTRASLTSREIEVLQLVATGQPNKSIARQLGIELGTVKSHVSAIMAKLGASSRTHASRIAAARGLVEEDVDTVDESMPPPRSRNIEARPQYA